MTGRVAGAAIAASTVALAAGEAVAQAAAVGVPVGSWRDAVGFGGGLLVAAVAGAAVFVPAVRRIMRPEVPTHNLQDEIRFVRIDGDGQTVVCEDGIEIRVLEVRGVNLDSMSSVQIEEARRNRANMLRLIADLGSVELIVLSERSRMPVTLAEGGDNEWLAAVNERWARGFKRSFVNRHTIVVVDREGGKLNQACDSIAGSLSDFGVTTLRHTVNGPSPLWSFLYRFVMGMGGPGYHGAGDDLPRELADGAMFFDEETGVVQVSDGERSRFWKTVSLDNVADEADDRLMLALGKIDVETTTVQRIRPMSAIVANNEINKKKTNTFTFVVNPLQKAEFTDALDNLNADVEGYAEYQVQVMAYGDTPAEADTAAQRVKSVMIRFRAQGVTETRFAEEAHWDRFPVKKPQWLRKFMPRLKDIAEWLPFEGTPRGLSKCWWGPAPLRTMRTTMGVPYPLGIHEHAREEALANVALIGKPGSGKTTAAAWLITGVRSHFPKARVFCFDNLDGLTVPTWAFGGRVISPGVPGDGGLALAPLQMADTRENREFLGQWLLGLAGLESTPDHEKVIGAALNMIMPQDAGSRTLTRFVTEGLPANNAVRLGLEPWIRGGRLSGWFDAERDAVDLEAAAWLTFNMTRVMESPRIASAMVAYILHRIQTEVWRRPTPHVIFIDEAASLAAANPMFVELIAYLLRNIRKKMGSVWVAFQDVGGMGPLGEVIRTNTSTMLFWRDPSATAKDYEDLQMSVADMRFIQDQDDGLRHLKRAMLAIRKQEAGRESVIIDADLGTLGNLLQLFRSGSDAAEVFQINRMEHGEARCVGPYLEAMKAKAGGEFSQAAE